MTAKTFASAKTFREMRSMEAEFQVRLDRLDKMTQELGNRVDRVGKSMGEKISGRMS